MDLRGNAVTWLGHGTWLWETSEGKRLLIDTWLAGNPATPDEYKDPAALKPDGILITHGHFDHIGEDGAEAVDAITKTGAPTFALFEVAVFLGGKGCEVTGFNMGGSVEVAGVTATMVNAVHSGGITARGRDDGLRRAADRLRARVPGRPGRLSGGRHRRVRRHGPDRGDLPART